MSNGDLNWIANDAPRGLYVRGKYRDVTHDTESEGVAT